MTLRTVSGQQTAEDVTDLVAWVDRLEGCPPVTRTVVATCRRPAHGEEPASWFYVEADAHEGVARLRCLACGDARPVLDSAERWSYPPVWACSTCNQSIVEVVFGIHGVGYLTYQALNNLDLPTIIATVVYGAFFIVLANAVVDIGYAWLDPRIRPT